MKKNVVTLSFMLLIVQFSIGQNSYFPERGEWIKADIGDLGVDQAAIETVRDSALAFEYRGPVDLRQAILKGFEREPYHKILGPTKRRGKPAGMILKGGKLVASWGDTKRVDMTFSVTKSYLSTVAGLAYDAGLIKDMEDKVIDYVWDGTFDGRHNATINWEHLLHQSSDWTGQLWGGYDWNDRPPKEGDIDDWKLRKLNTPGTVFEYNDVRVNVLAYSLLQVWRKPLPQVLKEEVMDPIGASSTWRWFGYENSWTNVDGIKMQSVSGGGHSGGGIFISAEDHARFGLLFLNKGMWDGQRIVSEEWIEMAMKPSPSDSRYGYMWWINPDGSDRMSHLSPNGFYAAGFGGNYIIVEPEEDLVIVMRWCDPAYANDLLSMIKDLFK